MLTVKQVGPLLGLSARKVYELARSGGLPSYRFGAAVRFDAADVDAYKQSCRVVPPPQARTRLSVGTPRLESADSELAAYFRAAGLKPRADPRIGRKDRQRSG